MKKLELNPVVAIAACLAIIGVSYYLGDKNSGQVNLPGLKATGTQDYSSLNSLYSLLSRNYDGKTDAKDALEGAKAGLVASVGDPYTAYLPADEAAKLSDDLAGKLSGIGAEIGQKNNILTVIAPISGAPAEKAGLKAGDFIGTINDEDTAGMSVDTAVSKIRGKKGTTVTLKIARSGSDPKSITITRDDITVPSVKSSMKNGNIAYINITQFGPDTATQVNEAANELLAKGAKRVILDLRNNPGGYLDQGVSVASQFLETDKLVVEQRAGGKSISKLSATSGGRLRGLPTIVLINTGSASASEIVAAALKDNGVARLVGEKSFGKGSVQEIKKLPGGAELKVTVAHWYTPAGLNLSKEGIKPDVEVKLTTEDYNASRDPQLDKALELSK